MRRREGGSGVAHVADLSAEATKVSSLELETASLSAVSRALA